jgi:hypothetical protein
LVLGAAYLGINRYYNDHYGRKPGWSRSRSGSSARSPTNVTLTPVGKQRIARHWEQLERLKNLSEPSVQQ